MIIINKWLFLNRSNKNYRNKNHFQRMLAIVIPYFKINFFEKTLESLAQQTDKRFHLYIGDDASPDAPLELLKKYEGQFNVTYKRFNNNLGGVSLVKQWERCIAMMQEEEWFMILGDDDVLGEKVVEVFYENLSEIERISHVVRFSSVLINEKDESISEEYHHPKLENAIESYCRKLKGESRSSLSEYIFRKESYSKLGFKDYALAWTTDDRAVIDFSKNKPIFSVSALVKVRMSNQNITGKKDNLPPKIYARLQSTREILEDYAHELTLEQRKILFSVCENQLYRLEAVNFSDALFLLKKSWQIFGFKYFVNQLKSVLIKKYFKGNIEFLNFYVRTKKLRKNVYTLKVQSIEETIYEVVNHRKSISRFGDGEFRLILPNENLKFQKENQLLTERLKEVLTSNLENHLVAIPESFHSVKAFKLNVKYFWIGFINNYGNLLSKYLNKEKTYGNAFISRFYLDYKNKSQVEKTIKNLKKIWNNKDVFIIEGEFSRLGIGNDLFGNVSSLQRLICPSKNAFTHYTEILEKAKELGKDKLILIALGPTASVLSYDLARAGFWAVDIGHVDIEYSWYLEKAEYKIPVKYRLVNESTHQNSIDLPENLRESYLNSIFYKISE